MVGSAGREGQGQPISACLPAQHKLPEQPPGLPFSQLTESNPALASHQVPTHYDLFLLTLVCEHVSRCTALQGSFLSASVDAALSVHRPIKANSISELEIFFS